MNTLKLYPLLFFASLLTSSTQAQTARSLMNQMYRAIDSYETIFFDMKSKERIKDSYEIRSMHFRVKNNPYKVYMRDLNSGVEVLYRQGWNDNEAYINPNGFPWTNVSLDPYGSRMRSRQHHTIVSSGFAYTRKLFQRIEKQLQAEGQDFNRFFSYKGLGTWNGKKCHKIYIEYPDYTYTSYTVKRTRNIGELCEELLLPEYKVREINRLGTSSRVRAGKTLRIPTAYAKKVIFYLDPNNYLPVLQFIYDDKGLYEKYEYTRIKTQPKVARQEWTTDCASYKF